MDSQHLQMGRFQPHLLIPAALEEATLTVDIGYVCPPEGGEELGTKPSQLRRVLHAPQSPRGPEAGRGSFLTVPGCGSLYSPLCDFTTLPPWPLAFACSGPHPM